jgi:hypothetical protein
MYPTLPGLTGRIEHRQQGEGSLLVLTPWYQVLLQMEDVHLHVGLFASMVLLGFDGFRSARYQR